MQKRAFIMLFVVFICIVGLRVYDLCTFRPYGIISCEYTYRYKSDDGNSFCWETVSLAEDDTEALLRILGSQWFLPDFDYGDRYSENYSLLFSSQNGPSYTLYPLYPRGCGYLKKGNGGFVCHLRNDAKNNALLYEILEKYEKHANVAQAG